MSNLYEISFQGHQTEIFDPVIFTKKDKIRIGNHCRIDGFVKIEGGNGVVIDDYVHIASFAHINVGGGYTHIGYKSAIASHAIIVSGSNSPKGLSMSASAPVEDQVISRGEVIIDNYAIVFAGGMLLPNVKLNEGAVVAAGAVVPSNTVIPAWEIWAGNPARKIADRLVEK